MATRLPLIHIVDAVIADLLRLDVAPGQVGLLATAATLKADLYQSRLKKLGWPCITPADDLMTDAVLPAIALVKRDRADEAARFLKMAINALKAQGASLTILACTELPVALRSAPDQREDCLDATEALARACISWYRASSR